MKYQRVKPDRELLELTAPIRVVGVALDGKYEVFMIAGTEGDDLICYAIFSHIPGKGADVFLEHLYTVPDRRDKGACCELLKECEKMLKAVGTKNILTRQIIDPKNALEYHEFITKRGFIPLNLQGRMLCYMLKEMLDSHTIQTILKHEKDYPQVKGIDGVGERWIKALLNRQDETGFFFYRDECDSRYSRFYEENGQIHAALIVSRTDEDTFFISSLYEDEFAREKKLYLILLSEVAHAMVQDTGTEDLEMIFVINNEEAYQRLQVLFNPPRREFLVIEHMRKL